MTIFPQLLHWISCFFRLKPYLTFVLQSFASNAYEDSHRKKVKKTIN